MQRPDDAWSVVETLNCGDRPTARSVLFSRDTSYKSAPTRFQCWLIRSGAYRVLIDLGLPSDDPRLRACTGARTTRELCAADIDADQVTDVVLTHLHWDHVGDIELFDNATVHVQSRELDFLSTEWFRRPALRDLFATQSKIDWILKNPKLHRIEGDSTIAAGITAVWVGGHTPGSQMVLVDLAGERAVFTGDIINTLHNLTHDVPPGLLWSMPEALDALNRIAQLHRTGYQVIPSHQPVSLPWDCH